jgi:hypothetical protein
LTIHLHGQIQISKDTVLLSNIPDAKLNPVEVDAAQNLSLDRHLVEELSRRISSGSRLLIKSKAFEGSSSFKSKGREGLLAVMYNKITTALSLIVLALSM